MKEQGPRCWFSLRWCFTALLFVFTGDDTANRSERARQYCLWWWLWKSNPVEWHLFDLITCISLRTISIRWLQPSHFASPTIDIKTNSNVSVSTVAEVTIRSSDIPSHTFLLDNLHAFSHAGCVNVHPQQDDRLPNVTHCSKKAQRGGFAMLLRRHCFMCSYLGKKEWHESQLNESWGL